ncbi:MAG: transcriptional regulator, partial [Actinomycetota bacterium]
MSLEIKHLYEFGEFRFDTKEKILRCGDTYVALAPKVFQLLSVFVENQGRLLEKDELMKKLWADSFVEESNLTFNIRQLRKILKDDAQQPNYIKTVPRHGYRFIAAVNEIFEEKLPAVREKPPAEKSAMRLAAESSVPVSNKTKFSASVFQINLAVCRAQYIVNH